MTENRTNRLRYGELQQLPQKIGEVSIENTVAIFCCGCEKLVDAKIEYDYQLFKFVRRKKVKRFLVCEACGSYVLSEFRRGKPNHIPSKELLFLQKKLHEVIDPLWKNGVIERGELYRTISSELGYAYHTANLLGVKQAVTALMIVEKISKRLRKRGSQ